MFYAPEIRLEFFDNMTILLDEIKDIGTGSRTHAEILCLGDFNCDALQKTSWKWRKLNEVMSNSNLSQLIKDPTRITQSSFSCVDHFWTNRPDLYQDSGVLTYSLSDHSLVYAVRKGTKISKGNFKFVSARPYKNLMKTPF